MRRSWLVPAAWVAAPLLYVVLVGWLMLHGFLDVAVVLVVVAVLALLGLAVWRWRVGHRRWAAVLAAGAVAVVAVVGWYGYSLNEKIAAIPQQIRGFGHIKDASIAKAKAEEAALWAAWEKTAPAL